MNPRYAFTSFRLVSHVAVVCVVAKHSAVNLLVSYDEREDVITEKVREHLQWVTAS